MCFTSSIFELLGFFHVNYFDPQVDIDEDTLERSRYNCEPYMADYLKHRSHPLKLDVFCGSIDEYDDCLAGTDFVFGIEV